MYFTLSFLVAQSNSETYQLCLSLSLFAKLFSQLYMYLLLAYTVTDSLILKYKIYQGHCISMSVVDWPFHHIYQIISMKESFWRLWANWFLFLSCYLFLRTLTVFCLEDENCIGEDDESYEDDIADKNYPHCLNDVRRDDPSNTDRYRAEQQQLKITKVDWKSYCNTL